MGRYKAFLILTRATWRTSIVAGVPRRGACNEQPAGARALFRLHADAATLRVVYHVGPAVPIDEAGQGTKKVLKVCA